MKNRINLFRRKPQVDYLSSHASLFKRYLTSAGIVLFIFFIFLMVQVFSLNKSLQDLLQKKGTYLQYLLSEKDIEANMLYFKSKQTQMNTFMKDDAHFVPYYQVLKSSLGQTGSNVVLDLSLIHI